MLFVYTELKKTLHDRGICSVASEGSSQMAQAACCDYLTIWINGFSSLEQGDYLASVEVSWSSFHQLREQGLGTGRALLL